MAQQKSRTATLNRILNATVWNKRLMATTAMTLAGALAMSSSAYALDANETPTGGVFAGGSTGTINGNGTNNMTVTQTGNTNSVIDWSTFNIGTNAKVEFKQLAANSRTVNRVNASVDGSQILGTLKSTVGGTTGGTIIILDPNGVIFGVNAKVDVGGLIASTGKMNNSNMQEFLAGRSFQLRQLDAENGTVENKGRISATDGGLVALVAPTVKNSGVINARLGTVVLASGRQVIVDFYGDNLINVSTNQLDASLVENSGTINAQGGNVTMTAGAAKNIVDSVVNMSGVINANSYQSHNGKIVLGSAGKVNVSGTLQARRETASGGESNAGSIDITGNDVEITSDAKILADITGTVKKFFGFPVGFNNDGNGNGGSVYIWGENRVIFAGHIDINGGKASGNGGTAEISGADDLGYRGTVDASADNGIRGTLRIDPAIVQIGNSVFDPVVNAAALAETLGLTNVHIIAGDKIVLVDDVNLSHWGFGGLQVTNGDLTLEAPTVDLIKNLTMGNGGLSVDAQTINLDGKIYSNTVPFVNLSVFNALMGSPKLSGTANLVNVLSDKANIQQGIDLANGTGSAKVYVAAGNYNENINIYKSLTLEGAAGPSQPLLFGINPLGQVIKVSANNVTVDGFDIIAETQPLHIPVLFGIVAKNVSGLTLKNNTITGPIGTGIVLNNVDTATLENNSVSTALTGIDVSGGTNISLLSNTILGAVTGLKLVNSNLATITGNTITNVLQNGIDVNGTTGSNISGNTVNGALLDGIFVNNAQSSTINGNTVSLALRDGISINNSATVGATGNTLSLIGRNGINVIDTTDVSIDANTVTGAGNDGIFVDPSSGSVTGNTVIGALNNGIELVDSYDFTVSGNTVLGAVNNGIAVSNGRNIKILGNTVTAVGQDGILVDGTDIVRIRGNTVSVTGDDGIDVKNTNRARVRGNTVSLTADNGIESTDSDNLSIFNNTLLLTGNSAIMAQGGLGAGIWGNTILGAGGDGIRAFNVGGLNIYSNTIGLTGDDGIDVQKVDNANIYGNTIAGTTDNGIEASSTNGVNIYGNTVLLAGHNGIHTNNADDAEIYQNTVLLSANDGIHVQNASGTAIFGNIVAANGRDGIRVNGASGTNVYLNAALGNSHDGIHIRNAVGSAVFLNGILLSGNDGIHVQNATGTVVTLNGVALSGGDGIDLNNTAGTLVAANAVLGSGRNGIKVTDSLGTLIALNYVNGAGKDGIRVNNSRLTGIVANSISNVDRNGINVNSSTGSFIAFNDLQNGLRNGIKVTDSLLTFVGWNTIDNFYNGIRVALSLGTAVVGNDIDNIDSDGIQVSYSAFTGLFGNTIRGYGDDGVQVNNSNGVLIAGNDIDGEGVGQSGVRIGRNKPFLVGTVPFSGSDNVIIAGNDIRNNNIGLNATAQNNGYIDVRGNTFTDNETGMAANSGVIDMTHAGNTFIGGKTALAFSGGYYPSFGYTGLRLVDDTIGTTVFEGQTDYYVDLRNGAFFEPGTPTIIDGTLATYDGVPGGLMTASQLLAIRAMIHDFNNDNTLGLFFPGYAELDDNQIVRKYSGNRYKEGRAGVLLTGLPFTGMPGSTPRSTPFFSVQDLANIAPAAGGDDDLASRLANIAPAAGGSSTAPQTITEGACWGNMGGGGGFSMDLGGSPTSILAAAAACKG